MFYSKNIHNKWICQIFILYFDLFISFVNIQLQQSTSKVVQIKTTANDTRKKKDEQISQFQLLNENEISIMDVELKGTEKAFQALSNMYCTVHRTIHLQQLKSEVPRGQ